MPYDTTGPSFDGRFSDGKTAAARDVTVAFTPRGLVLSVPGEDAPIIWPYGALSTAEPLSSHAVDALVSYTYQPGASLFVPNGSFARRLAEAAPQLTTRAARRRAATPWVIASILVAIVAALVSLAQLSPARTLAGLMPESVRNTLGAQTIRSMTSGKKVCDTSQGTDAVKKLAARLSAGVPGGSHFDITVVDWDLVNAFAAPGNKIVLTQGLIAAAAGPDEIAGVLAHEMGHGIEMHPETGIVRAVGLSAAVELLLGGSGGTVGNFGVLLAQLSYTRQAEAAADEQAIALLRAASVSTSGLAGFFRRMKVGEGDHSKRGGSLALRHSAHTPAHR